MLSPYIPWPLYGGPPIRIYYVLRELVRLGHEVVLLAGHDGPSLPQRILSARFAGRS